MMAQRLSRSLRRTTPTSVLSSKCLIQQSAVYTNSPEDKKKKLGFLSLYPNACSSTRSYITEMRKQAFEGNILRLLRNEIQYELERSPPTEPVPEYDGFTVDERPGEQWIRLNRKFGEDEEIKVEVTMFDGLHPVEKPGAVDTDNNGLLHITMIVDIFKGDGNTVLEFVCSAWPNSVEIQKVFVRGRDRMAGQPYTGPQFKDLDDSLQDKLYEYLETRGIDDELAEFLHEYLKNKDKSEFIGWMGKVRDFIGGQK